ncbi:hypothetical protein V1264_007676 [Littorina saxatilis]|uniref:SPOC domain-containing protein n=2 Tax=Littorina saxatilis TaxID=31220 RepID=A0AAN9AWX6_9CAEN
MDQGLNMNISSPRASRSGSSPRAARGGQSPKNPPTPSRGRGSSPKASNEMGSPVVKLEKLEVGRGKRGKDDTPQKGRPGAVGKESEFTDNVAHQTFEDWKASNMLSTVDPKPISKDNIYEFEASEQEQKLEPSPTLRGARGRNKRASESSDGKTPEMLCPLSAPPPLQPAPQQGAPLGATKEPGPELEQASDDSTSSMSNVDKMIKVSSMSNVDRIIDAVSKGIFDVSDHHPDLDEKIPQRPSTGRGRGAKAAAAAAAAAANPVAAAAAVLEQAAENKPEPMVAASPSMPGKLVMDFPMPGGHVQHPAMAGPPPHHKGKGKQHDMPKMPVPLDMPNFSPGFHQQGFPMHSEVGPMGKAGPAMKQEQPPVTTMAWQSVVSTASGGVPGKPPMTPDMPGSSSAVSQPHGMPVSTQPHSMPVVSHAHGLPPPPHAVPDVMGRGKKGEGLPHPPVSEPHPGLFSHMPPHQGHTQGKVRGGPPGRDDSSPLAQMSSMFPPGHPASIAAAAEQARRSGVFAVPISRDQGVPPPQGLVTGPPMMRSGSYEPRYTSPKMPSTPVNVITTGSPMTTTSSLSGPPGHGKHGQHPMTSPTSIPPVPALVQAPGALPQGGPKMLHGMPKGWPGMPGSLPGQQTPIHTPPPPSPSQISPTSPMQPQRPQSAQLPVMPTMDPNLTPLALKRPPSAHNSGRDMPGRPPSHHGEMRPPSLPGDIPPSELAGKASAAAERRERELERERELGREQQREREQREREHMMQLANLQRQGLAPHGHPGFYMVQGEHGPMTIPHGMVPPHSQHDPKMVSAGPSVSGAPVSVAVTSPATSRRGSVQDSLSKMPPATSAAALYSGVVAGQPRSLSPKTASPVGQVIERLPNPMRPQDIHGLRAAGHPRMPAPPQDQALLIRLKEEVARGIHPQTAHGEPGHPAYDIMTIRSLQQQQHQQMLFMQDQAARTAAAARGARAQELAHSSALAHEMAARNNAVAQEAAARKSAQETARNAEKEAAARAAAAQEAAKAKEAARNEAAFKEAVLARNAAMERSIQARGPQEASGKGGPPPHSQMMGMQPSPVSMQQQPLNLADSDSRSSSSERSSTGKPNFSMPPGPHAGFMERERGGKGADRPPPDTPHLPSSAFVPPPGGAPGSLREGLPVYGSELPFSSPFGIHRMPLDPRVFPGQQHHPQFLPSREGVLSAPFQQFVPGAGGQRFPLDQHPEAERLMKKGELPPPAPLMPMGRSPSPIPSPSPRLPPEMVGHPIIRMADMPARENLHTVLGRYPMVWQGMLALKNDQSYVQMHFVSGSKDLPEQALPRAICNQALPLRISQRMRLEQPNLEGVTKRMINEKDYTLLLAVPCGVNHLDITDQTKNLTVGFIEYLRSKLAAGIVNVSQPGTNQPAFVVHVFPPCEFSMEVVANHSQGLVEQIHDLAHVIIIITTV